MATTPISRITNQSVNNHGNKGENYSTGHGNYSSDAREISLLNKSEPQNNSNAITNNVQFIEGESQKVMNSMSNFFPVNC